MRVNIAGTNDAPVITSGPGSGAVTENGSLAFSGLMTAFDPDNGARMSWTVVGGDAPQAADYEFYATISASPRTAGRSSRIPSPTARRRRARRPSPTAMLTPTASTAPSTETGGKLILDSDNAAPVLSVGTPDPFIGNLAIVRSNIDPANLDARPARATTTSRSRGCSISSSRTARARSTASA